MSSEDFHLLSQEDRKYLNHRQAVSFNTRLEEYLQWLRNEGKDPGEERGYAEGTVKRRLAVIKQIFRWSWEKRDRISTELPTTYANSFVAALNSDNFTKRDGEAYSTNSKRKYNDTLRSWFRFQGGSRAGWEPPTTFDDKYPENPADAFTRSERQALYDAALRYKTVPKYGNLSPEDRERRKATLAQELGKPKQEVTPEDFRRINRCWKIPSLVSTTLDLGLRPVEIERFNLGWLQLDKEQIHIPREDAAKNRSRWKIAILPRTADHLRQWLNQRDDREKYDDSEAVWLNREGNRYESGPLNNLLRGLLKEAGISQENRKLVWYSFRHSTGQYVYDAADKDTAAKVLRHKDSRSTDRYAGPTHEQIQQAQRDANR